MNVRRVSALTACAFAVSACGPTRPPVASAPPPVQTSMMGQPGAPPVLDRYGQPNYDAQGAYTGGHGVGTLVDNPDRPAPPQPAPDPVRAEQQKVDDAMCKSIRAADPNAAC